MNPFFYIIVPIYNVQTYLHQCLDSLINQTYTHFKAILINDGSTDLSGQIAQEYCDKDSRFVLITQQNAGLSMARNAGLAYIKNDLLSIRGGDNRYIVFVDSDDYIELDGLQKCVDIFRQYDVELVSFSKIMGVNPSSGERKEYEHRVFAKELVGVYTPLEIIRAKTHIPIAIAWTFVAKSNFIFDNDISFIPHIFYEDGAFCTTLTMKCKHIYISDETYYNYVLSPDSIMRGAITRTKRIKQAYSYFILLCHFNALYNAEEIPEFKEFYRQNCIDNAKGMMKKVQYIGYAKDLGFSKQDIAPMRKYIPLKYRILCYNFPRIYGFRKKVRLWFMRYFGAKQ